jgi:hypothetical protein
LKHLPDRRLLRAKQMHLHRLDAQLVHLVDGRANSVDVFAGGGGEAVTADASGQQPI